MSGRAFVVKRLKPLPIEAIVRGYVIGSGWKDYKKTNTNENRPIVFAFNGGPLSASFWLHFGILGAFIIVSFTVFIYRRLNYFHVGALLLRWKRTFFQLSTHDNR